MFACPGSWLECQSSRGANGSLLDRLMVPKYLVKFDFEKGAFVAWPFVGPSHEASPSVSWG